MIKPALVASAISCFAFVGAAAASDWVGLYKGLDALDGSIDYMSISPSGSDKYEIRTVPSIISLCESGRGWIVGEGHLEDGKLHRRNALAYCEGQEPFAINDRVFERDEETGIIRFGASDDDRPLIYHRVSDD